MNPFKLVWKAAGGGVLAGGTVAMFGPDFQPRAGEVLFDVVRLLPGTENLRQSSWEWFLGVMFAMILAGIISGTKSAVSGDLKK